MSNQNNLTNVAESYLRTLVLGTEEELTNLVGENGYIDDPREGSNVGAQEINKFSRKFKDWLGDAELETEMLRITASDSRVCSEDILHIKRPNEYLQLPVATVISSDTASGANVVHVYYTQWPFNKHHSVRPGLYSEPQTVAPHSDVILKYFESLVSGDIEKTLECFEADIYFREASGPPYVHWGKYAVRQYFLGLFGKGAPMLRDDTIIDDGRCAVMEFTVVGWNGVKREPNQYEAGLAVYQRSNDGLISAIRIYDDVDF